MAQHAVTLKPMSPEGGATELHPAAPGGARCDAMKFTYATGARPLDGFTIKRGIGVGGFGEVYYAVSDAGKEVALKRIQRHLDIELRGVGQCLNLKHPNLVSLHDIKYDEQGEAWVVMEYVVGESLRDALDRCPEGLPIAEVHHWFLGMSAGVAYLHDRGIVHRDLKPGNIFSDEGVVKIGDYGLSKFISCSRRSGQTESVGTFHYMAPEIGRGSYGKQIDIYALGVILYELLTGRVPFEGESTQEIIMKHLTADPDLSAAPRAFRDVIRRALMKDPEKRFRNVGEMLEAVQNAIAASGAKVETRAAGYHPAPAATARATYDPRQGRAGGPEIVDAQVVPEAANGPSPAGQGAPRQAAQAPLVAPTAAPGLFDGEPIAEAVRSSLGHFMKWMNDPATNNGTRFLVVGAIALTIFWNSAWIFPLAIVLGVAYAAYFAVRLLVVGPSTVRTSPAHPAPGSPGAGYQNAGYQNAGYQAHAHPGYPQPGQPLAAQGIGPSAAPYAAAQPVAMAHGHGPALAPVMTPAMAKAEKSKRRVRTSEAVRALLARRPRSEQARELSSSLLVATVVAAILSMVGLLLGEQSASLTIDTASTFAWIWGTTVLGAWVVLACGKAWEHSTGDEVWRRFAMLVGGMGVGLAAWGVDSYLGLQLSPVPRAAVRLPGIGSQLYDSSLQQPQLAAYLLFFGFQFLVIRWWRQADSLRYTRLSIWDAGVCVIGALIVSRFVPFWSPWGLIIPAAISLTVQLSAPWINQADRARLRDEVGVAA